jgi:hypothetical protein
MENYNSFFSILLIGIPCNSGLGTEFRVDDLSEYKISFTVFAVSVFKRILQIFPNLLTISRNDCSLYHSGFEFCPRVFCSISEMLTLETSFKNLILAFSYLSVDMSGNSGNWCDSVLNLPILLYNNVAVAMI